MSFGTLHHALGVRHGKSLVSRGGLARTFGSLAGFLVLLFLFSGFYILEDAFTNPIQAGAAALIAAAFIIALAAMLLFFLLKPRNRLLRGGHRPNEAPSSKTEILLDSPARPFPQDRHDQA